MELKKFIRFCFVFQLGIVSIFLINLTYNYTKNNEPFYLNSETKIIAIGDSHITAAINPSLFLNLENVSVPGEPYIASYFKLKKLLSENRNVRKIILGYSYSNISGYNDYKFYDDRWSIDQFDKYSNIVPFYNFLGKLNIDYKSYIQANMRNLLFQPKEKNLRFIGNYIPHIGELSDSTKSSIRKHYFNDENEMFPLSVISINALDSIANYCAKSKVELILLGAPLHINYRANVPSHFNAAFKNLSKRVELNYNNTSILDYSDLALPDSLFYDYDHLNKEGGDFFSQLLFEDLNY